MTMRRILPCVLVLFVLLMAGSYNGGSTKAGQKKKATSTKTANANTNQSASQSSQGQTRRAQASATNNEAAGDSNSNAITNSNTPAQSNDGAQKGAEQIPKSSNQDQHTLNQNTEESSLLDWVIRALVIAAGVLILAVIGMGVWHLRNQSSQYLQHQLGKVAAANASVTREAQKEILDKLSSLSSAQNDTNTRLYDVHTEIRTLARLVRETSPSRGDGRSYASLASSSSYSYNEPSQPKEEPEFPVFAGDYIGKMTRFANVVKPDFQNGILINDPEGKGELMLIKDSRYPDETQPLFVVPRHAQFQTPQDFYTYYEKYYDCMKPGAGEVWIIDPAVVEKVSGGWLLREKGVLEIR